MPEKFVPFEFDKGIPLIRDNLNFDYDYFTNEGNIDLLSSKEVVVPGPISFPGVGYVGGGQGNQRGRY